MAQLKLNADWASAIHSTTTNPGVNNDDVNTAAASPAIYFRVGDTWLNTTTKALWACISNATGAAVWRRVDVAPHVSASFPTVNNDGVDTAVLGRAFYQGDLWICTQDSRGYILECVSNSTGAAVWKIIIPILQGSDPTVANDGVDSRGTGVRIQTGEQWINYSTNQYFFNTENGTNLAVWYRLPTQTAFDRIYYADGTSGSDSNTGLSDSSKKKTLAALFDIIPENILHSVKISLTGTFEDIGYTILKKFIQRNGSIFIDGGTALTIVKDDTGSPYPADLNRATSTVGHTGAAWTVNEYAGLIVEIVAGNCAGQHRLIVSNTADTITTCAYFNAVPDANTTFRISRPTTSITKPGSISQLRTQCYGTGSLILQNLYFGAGAILYIQDKFFNDFYPYTKVSHIIVDATSGVGMQVRGGGIECVSRYNFASGAYEEALTYSQCNLSVRGSGNILHVYDVEGINIDKTFINQLSCNGLRTVLIARSVKIKEIIMKNSQSGEDYGIWNGGSATATKIGGGTGVGISLRHSRLNIGEGAVSDCTSHGIDVNHSYLRLYGVVSGSGNGGAGVYAHNGSVVNTKSGSTPTLTGTVGNFAIDDPATQYDTWANVNAGTGSAVLSEMTMVALGD